MSVYPVKKYSIVGACGLDCGLCPRFYTKGESRCPGCCGPDFWNKHPSCGFITCCVKQRNLETCAQCVDWEHCDRVIRNLQGAKNTDSFISYQPLTGNFAFIHKNGIDDFVRLELEKIKFLRHLIENYDEGRSRSFYCLSCQLIPLENLRKALLEAEEYIGKDHSIKDKAGIVRAAITSLAKDLNISLKLRK